MFANRIKLGFIVGSILLGNGCSMCCGVYDYDYPTYGGLIQRSDPSYGRVGSVFSDPNAPLGVPAALGVEAVPERAMDSQSNSGPNDSSDLEPLKSPKGDTPKNDDAQKPAEELKEELLKDLNTKTTYNAPKRMMVRPVRMLQRTSGSQQANRIQAETTGNRYRNLFQ